MKMLLCRLQFKWMETLDHQLRSAGLTLIVHLQLMFQLSRFLHFCIHHHTQLAILMQVIVGEYWKQQL